MKSKRVDVFLMDNSLDPDDYCGSEINSGSVVQIDYARKAVELAEQDARDRAEKTFRKSCNTGCISCYRTDCPPMSTFLKYYDNES